MRSGSSSRHSATKRERRPSHRSRSPCSSGSCSRRCSRGSARRQAMVLGETVFAKLRDQFMERVTSIPLSVVERAGTGDLLTRTTSDIDSVSTTVRFAIPQLVVSAITVSAHVPRGRDRVSPRRARAARRRAGARARRSLVPRASFRRLPRSERELRRPVRHRVADTRRRANRGRARTRRCTRARNRFGAR